MIGSLLAADGADNVIEWFTDRAARANDGAITEQAWLTVWHSAVAVLIVVVVTVPVAAVLAHHRKGELTAAFFVSIGRAIPTVAVVGMAVIVSLRNGFGFEPWPIIIALVLLGIPPAFANTYAAVRGVDEGAVSAAVAMGGTHSNVILRVELPLALPVILAGIRTATVQIVATEPLGAFFGGEGLGAYLRQGLTTREFSQVQAGALLVTAVAVGAELLWAAMGRIAVPAGIRRTAPRRRRWAERKPAPAT
ncbi:MAG: ABC transporter permease [Actinomycetota bacterium]|nr:ABC transporter permease [Actinomycetota bacterium]